MMHIIKRRVHTRDANVSADTDASARTFTPATQVVQAMQAKLVSACVCVCVTSIHTWKFMKQEQTQAQDLRKKTEFAFFLGLRLRQVTLTLSCFHCSCVSVYQCLQLRH